MNLTPLEAWIARKASLERLTRAELEAYQLAGVQNTLRLIRENSPFYREHLSGYPGTLDSLAGLSALPFTTADDIRQNPLRFLCVSQGEVERVVTLPTSGTTGTPKRLFFSQADQELTLDFFHIGMSTFTKPGDRVLILLPVERRGSVGDLLADALERMGAHGIRHGPVQDVAETLETLFDEGANAVVGVPTQVLALVRAPAARRFPTPPIETVLLSMDHVPASVVSALEYAWPCTVYNHYGMTEMGLGGGVDCEARRGYHLREADLYVEIVDPQTGEPVPDGQVGEVVFTTLTRQAMPLLRYRTGDISRFLPGACPCGSCLKTLAHVRSRVRGILPLGADASISLAELDEVIFRFDKVLDFTATLDWADGRPYLAVRLHVAAPPSEPLIAPVRAALGGVQAVHSGALAVSVTGEQSAGGAPPTHAKRRIRVGPGEA